MTVQEVRHAVIEQAKASYKADGCDMAFEECLSFHATSMIAPPLAWAVGERNGAWALDVWEGSDGR